MFNSKIKIMKKMKLSVIILLCSLNFLFAQEPNKKFKEYKVWASKIDNSKVIKGILLEANDASLRIIGKKNSEIIVNVKDIHKIKIRRKGKGGKGAAIGAATGVATGLVIGFSSGDDPDKTVDGFFPYLGSYTYIVEGTTAGEKAASWAVGLGIAGTVVGALVGSKKEVFLINGDISKYQMYFDEIQTYSMNRKK